MSHSIDCQIGSPPDVGFIVKTLANCRIVYGSVPLAEFGMLAHGFSDNAVMSPELADLIGAAFVIGEPEDIDTLRSMDLPVSAKRQAEHDQAAASGLSLVALWLRNGNRGRSSNAMCKHIFGLPISAGVDHPRDPDDLRRCLQFLEATQSAGQLHLMRSASPEWERLTASWDRIVSTFHEETANGKSAEKTYLMLRDALAPADQ